MQTVKTLSELLREFPDDIPVILEVEGVKYEMGAVIYEEHTGLIITPQYRYADDGITPKPAKINKK